jgi:hypothetical protein
MLTYKKCVKLAKAGYPQHERAGIGNGDVFITGNCGLLYCPSLSELIEACGGEMRTLYYHFGEWVASNSDCLEQGWEYSQGMECIGETPDEAVADLWLILNENKC